MADTRIKITLTNEERDLFEQCKVRSSDSLAGTIVRLALAQTAFLRKAASGAFRPANGRLPTPEPGGIRYDRSDAQ